jgi:hypothetical protein
VAAFKALARWVLLLLLLVEIGVLSLAWNGLAWVLHRVLPARRGTVIGRVAIGHIYATLWRTAQALGMMQIDTGVSMPWRTSRKGSSSPPTTRPCSTRSSWSRACLVASAS